MILEMKKHNTEYNMKDLNMNGKTLLTACLMALFGLSGCALFQRAPSEQNTIQADTNTQMCLDGICETDPFVNYTQTRADYREYGELSERDVIVSQSGAGNNLSAAIPPSLEDEMVEYEEQVENEAAQAEAAVDSLVPVDADSVQNADVANIKLAQDTTNDTEIASDSNTEEFSQTVNSDADTQSAENGTIETETVAEEVSEENGDEIENENENEDEDDEDPVRDWYAEEGQNLKALLTDWSSQSGWRIVWNTNRNYVLNAGAMFRGRFADVSSALIRAFARARPAPIATFYKGNRVLVVETMEDENAYD